MAKLKFKVYTPPPSISNIIDDRAPDNEATYPDALDWYNIYFGSQYHTRNNTISFKGPLFSRILFPQIVNIEPDTKKTVY